MRTLYIHIGTPKTGTTSIQRFLHCNQDKLLSKELLYPKTGLDYTSHHVLAASLYCQMLRTRERGVIYFDDEVRESILNDYFCEVDSAGVQASIISSEMFWKLEDLQRFDAFKERYDCKIIVYIRRQDKALVSSYSSLIKQGKTKLRLNEHIESLKNNYLYLDKLDSLSEYFGKSNLIVRLFDPCDFINNDLISDFMTILGVDIDKSYIYPDDRNKNVSLTTAKLEFKRLLNEQNLDKITNRKISWLLMLSDELQGDLRVESMLSSLHREELLDYFASENDKIRKKYFPELERNTLFDMSIETNITPATQKISLDQAMTLFSSILEGYHGTTHIR